MRLKVYFRIIFICLLVASIVSCDDKDHGYDFDIPQLTVNNTIQFSVDGSGSENRTLEIFAHGRFAVDWGDGVLDKSIDVSLVHRYKSQGDFRVRIWSDELTFLNVSGLLIPISDPQIGICPLMINLHLNSFSNTVSLDLTNCPNLTSLNIGNHPLLENVDLSNCLDLRFLNCYTHPKLTSIDLSKNKKLEHLSLNGTSVTKLSLSENTALTSLEVISNGELSSIIYSKMEHLYKISLIGNKISDLDATLLPNIVYIDFTDNKFTSLDFSTNDKLRSLKCKQNELDNLIIKEECNIRLLDCSSNNLNAENLNTIFTRLPQSPVPAPRASSPSPDPMPNFIEFHDNPGAEGCDEKIIKDKGWKIITE